MSRPSEHERLAEKLSEKQKRLVNWITNEMCEILRQIEVSRIGKEEHEALKDLELLSVSRQGEHNPLDEVEEIITLPKYTALSRAYTDEFERDNFHLSASVKEELRVYVSCLAAMYQENPFHNFEHAR